MFRWPSRDRGRRSHPIEQRETADGPDHWLFKTKVVSYLGIGRFVLGLYEDIEVLGDDNFKKYILEKRK